MVAICRGRLVVVVVVPVVVVVSWRRGAASLFGDLCFHNRDRKRTSQQTCPRLSPALHAPFSASSGCDELGIENDLFSFISDHFKSRKQLINDCRLAHTARITTSSTKQQHVELWELQWTVFQRTVDEGLKFLPLR